MHYPHLGHALNRDTNGLTAVQIAGWTTEAREKLWAIREAEKDLFGRRADLQSELESTLKWSGKLVEGVEGERNEASKKSRNETTDCKNLALRKSERRSTPCSRCALPKPSLSSLKKDPVEWRAAKRWWKRSYR
jgi:hypothetical protein